MITGLQTQNQYYKKRYTMVCFMSDEYQGKSIDLGKVVIRNAITFEKSKLYIQKAEELTKKFRQLTRKLTLNQKEKKLSEYEFQ